MSALGVHFALTDDQVAELQSFSDHEARRDYIFEEIEPQLIDSEWAVETDKSWDAIHRCLTGQPATESQLISAAGTAPLNLLILGGRELDCADYLILRLIDSKDVPALAAVLQPIDDEWMRAAYHRHCKGAWPMYGEDDCEYMINWLGRVREFVIRVAPTGRHILFSATQ